jgi:hypothetical protein
MESHNQNANLIWVRNEDSQYMPIRNYNPEIKLIEDEKKDE